jgi:hypothetical protein
VCEWVVWCARDASNGSTPYGSTHSQRLYPYLVRHSLDIPPKRGLDNGQFDVALCLLQRVSLLVHALRDLGEVGSRVICNPLRECLHFVHCFEFPRSNARPFKGRVSTNAQKKKADKYSSSSSSSSSSSYY